MKISSLKYSSILKLTFLGFILFLFSCSRSINGIQLFREKKNKTELFSKDFENSSIEIVLSSSKTDILIIKNEEVSSEEKNKCTNSKEIIEIPERNKFKKFIEPKISTTIANLVFNAVQKNIFSVSRNENVKSDDLPIHWAAVLSFIFGTISIICIALYFFGPISIFVLPLQLISIALAITFGLIAKATIKKNPDKYSGYELASDGLKFGIAMLYLLLAVLLFGILFFTYIMG